MHLGRDDRKEASIQTAAEPEFTAEQIRWRFALGTLVLVGAYIAWPLIPVVMMTDLEPGIKAAISGVLGAYIIMFSQNRVRVLMGRVVTTVPAFVMIGLWIVLQFFNGIGSLGPTQETDGVAYAAHIGGFLAGVVLTFLLRGFARPASVTGPRQTLTR